MKLLVSVFICGVLACAAAQENCPEIFPRGAWSGIPARHIPVLPMRPAPWVIVHPTHRIIDELCTTAPACTAKIRDIQSFQMRANNWPDISYHFIMTAQQVFYTGRGWGRMGENVGAFNDQAINIGMLGMEFTPSAITAGNFNRFIDCGIQLGFLDPNVRIIAQCQITEMMTCDTSNLYQWLTEHPRYETNPQPL